MEGLLGLGGSGGRAEGKTELLQRCKGMNAFKNSRARGG